MGCLPPSGAGRNPGIAGLQGTTKEILALFCGKGRKGISKTSDFEKLKSVNFLGEGEIWSWHRMKFHPQKRMALGFRLLKQGLRMLWICKNADLHVSVNALICHSTATHIPIIPHQYKNSGTATSPCTWRIRAKFITLVRCQQVPYICGLTHRQTYVDVAGPWFNCLWSNGW